MIALCIAFLLLVLVLLSVQREGFNCSVEKCRKDQSYIQKDDLFCCFDPNGKKENLLSKQSPYSKCEINPGKNQMTLYDSYGTPSVYDTPVYYNCNPYNVLVKKK